MFNFNKIKRTVSKYVKDWQQVYIHYGSDHFDKKMFGDIKNRELSWNKPEKKTGLWASPIDSKNGWVDWCFDNDFHVERLKQNFIFTLKPNAKIIRIYTDSDLDNKLSEGVCERIDPYPGYMSDDVYFDFEQLVKDGYDAIDVRINSNYLYMSLYGWDCDSILVLNPDCIIEL